MAFPGLNQPDLPDLFEKMAEYRKVLSNVDTGAMQPEMADLFNGLVMELDSVNASMKAHLPGLVEKVNTDYKAAVGQAEAEHADNMAMIERARQQIAEAPAKEAERQRQLKQASDQLRAEREMAEQAQREARLAAKPQTLSFHEGEELVGMLMAVMAPPPPEKPKTIKPSGNIWEEWGKPAK